MDREIRTVEFRDVEVRQATEDEPPVIRGYAALYDVETDLGYCREVIRPGAFTAALKRDDVRALFNHDPSFVLGRTKSGTLLLDEDARGLPVVIVPPDATWARDLIASMQRGDVNQMSFAFSVNEETWLKEREYETPLRELLDVTLYDVSVVTFPAYPETSAQVRAAARAFVEQDTLADGAGQAGGESDDDGPGDEGTLQARGRLSWWRLELAERM